MTHVLDRTGTNQMILDCPQCGWAGIISYTTKMPKFCSNACRQKDYRARKAQAEPSEKITRLEKDGVTNSTRPKIERAIDMVLHLLKCPECKRSIWTVLGNVQAAGLRCGLCDVDFEPIDKRLRRKRQ